MPTALPRRMITETPPVQAAIDAGQERWPDLSRGQVAARLLAEIGEARELERVREELAERHRRALRNPPPEIARWFPVGAFGELREDWPE